MKKVLYFLPFFAVSLFILAGCPEDDDEGSTGVSAKMIAVGEEDEGVADEAPVILTTSDMSTWTRVVPTAAAWATDAGVLTFVKRFTFSTATYDRYFVLSHNGGASDDITSIWYADTVDAAGVLQATINWYSAEDTFAVTAVDEVGESFTVAGDYLTVFTTGTTFTISGSTENDFTWTVDSASVVSGNTVIVVTGDAAADSADMGTITVTYTGDADHTTDNPEIRDLVMVNETTGFAIGSDNCFLYTTDGGVTWNEGNMREDNNDLVNDFGAGQGLMVYSNAVAHFVFFGTDYWITDGIWCVVIPVGAIGATTDLTQWNWFDDDAMGLDSEINGDEVYSMYLHDTGTAMFILAIGDGEFHHFGITFPTDAGGLSTAPALGTITNYDAPGSASNRISKPIMVTEGTATYLYFAQYSNNIYRINVANLDASFVGATHVEVVPVANNELDGSYQWNEDYVDTFVYAKNTALLLCTYYEGEYGYGLNVGKDTDYAATTIQEMWWDFDDDVLPDNGVVDEGLPQIETVETGQTAGAGTTYDLNSWASME